MPPLRFGDPESLFLAAVDALNTGDYRTAAACCDPASLRVFRQEFLGMLASVHNVPPTADELLSRDPKMSREMAEYQAAAMKDLADPLAHLKLRLPRVSSMEDAESLTPADLFAEALAGSSPDYRAAQAIDFMRARGKSLSEEQTASIADAMRTASDRTLLGSVPDGERLVHVLYRLTPRVAVPPDTTHDGSGAQAEEYHAIEVQTARRQPDGTWLLLAGHEFLGTHLNAILAISVEDAPTETL